MREGVSCNELIGSYHALPSNYDVKVSRIQVHAGPFIHSVHFHAHKQVSERFERHVNSPCSMCVRESVDPPSMEPIARGVW